MIYLEHPVHGRKIATLEAEATADEAAGWTRYTPGKPKVSALETPTEYVNTMDVKRRGRVPRSNV